MKQLLATIVLLGLCAHSTAFAQEEPSTTPDGEAVWDGPAAAPPAESSPWARDSEATPPATAERTANTASEENEAPPAVSTQAAATNEPTNSEPAQESAPTLVWTPDLSIFGRYNLNLTQTDAGSTWYHSFDLTRAHVGLRADYGDAHARVLLEGTSSTEQGSLFGVAGDSFVVRFREAWAGYSFLERSLEVRAGIVPTLTIPVLEASSQLRPIERSALEQANYAAAADLGATAVYRFPNGYGTVGVGGYNGEGYTQRELNRGKTLEGALELHPFAAREELKPFGILLSYVQGSLGAGSMRANRVTASLLWRSTRIYGGAMFAYAWGVAEDGSVVGHLLDLWVRAEPIDNVLIGARFSRNVRNVDVEDDALSHVMLTIGGRLAEPLEVYAAVQRNIPGQATRLSLPGSDTWDFSVIVRTAFGGITP